MRKFFLAVAVLLVANAGVARADRMAPLSIPERTLKAEIVIAGKVVGVDKETVQVLPYKGAEKRVAYQIATVKVDTGLIGADKIKEVRVGFLARDGAPVPRRGWDDIVLKDGDEWLLFLTKHPTADFYITPWMYPAVDLKTEPGKQSLDTVKRIAAVLADPEKALKSDKPETRAEAATIVVSKYRQAFLHASIPTEQLPISAEESKLLLKALAEGNWSSQGLRGGLDLNPMSAFQMLGLTDKDGWVAPVIVNNPGAPPVDFGLVYRDAYMKWLEGAGKDYRIKKVVPKGTK